MLRRAREGVEAGERVACSFELVRGDDHDACLVEQEAHRVVRAQVRSDDVDPAAAQERSVDAEGCFPATVDDCTDVFLH